jgi:predicted DsbA family dithiol-disulfide isomerase
MKVIEVFADVACPFTHAGLCRFRAHRQQRGRVEPLLRVRAWPLELVNGEPLNGRAMTPKIEGLRVDVATDLFRGFDEDRFPATTLPAMAAEAAAYRGGIESGERFSFAVRAALFEEGLDVSDPDVLRGLRDAHGVPDPTDADRTAVTDDLADGRRRGVTGSPHFFTAGGDFFCPSIHIEHDAAGYEVSFDSSGFQRFISAAFD